jgi:hypothetical protein
VRTLNSPICQRMERYIQILARTRLGGPQPVLKGPSLNQALDKPAMIGARINPPAQRTF